MPTPNVPPLSPDFRDLLCALSAAEARFLIVGGYAVAAHGRPRATKDLDVWVEATPENAPRVMQALRVFGAPLRGGRRTSPMRTRSNGSARDERGERSEGGAARPGAG